MITRDKVLELLNAFPQSLDVICAGSAAISPHLAEDVDIWILNGFKAVPTFGFGNEFDPFKYMNNTDLQFIHEAYRSIVDDIKVQTFYTEFGTPEDLLNRFDLSIHAWAIDQAGRTYNITASTYPEERIRIIRHGDPMTVRRLYDITERYGAYERKEATREVSSR